MVVKRGGFDGRREKDYVLIKGLGEVINIYIVGEFFCVDLRVVGGEWIKRIEVFFEVCI
jgi:hypothetical protein